MRDDEGALAAVDDPRLAPIWETAGELGLPVLIHVADPVAFFDPLDAANERWEELCAHPDWHFPSPPYPALPAHPQRAGQPGRPPPAHHLHRRARGLLRRKPGLGRRPARALPQLLRRYHRPHWRAGPPALHRPALLPAVPRPHPVRPDLGPQPAVYRLIYRFLETDDEYFTYSPDAAPAQGRWQVYGLHLPDDVLEKVYFRNAARILNPS